MQDCFETHIVGSDENTNVVGLEGQTDNQEHECAKSYAAHLACERSLAQTSHEAMPRGVPGFCQPATRVDRAETRGSNAVRATARQMEALMKCINRSLFGTSAELVVHRTRAPRVLHPTHNDCCIPRRSTRCIPRRSTRRHWNPCNSTNRYFQDGCSTAA